MYMHAYICMRSYMHNYILCTCRPTRVEPTCACTHCRDEVQKRKYEKTKRSFNEQKIQLRIQKCPRLFRLRSSEKYKKTVCKLIFHVLVALSRGRLHKATIRCQQHTSEIGEKQCPECSHQQHQHKPKTFMSSASVHSCLCPKQK